MDIASLLALVIQRTNLRSHRQIGDKIGVAGQNVSLWARGKTLPTDQHIVKLCKLAKEDPVQWIVAIRFAHSPAESRQVWAKIYDAVTASNAPRPAA